MSVATTQAKSTVAAKRPALSAMSMQVENHTMPLDMLCRSEQNVRTRSTDEADEIGVLAELIFTFGLINPLSIVDNTQGDDDRFPVAAGDRRFRALMLLASQGRIRPDEPIDVRRFDSADALGLSLAENSGRLEMHPVDQYEAFRKLVEVEGKTLDEVADVHGVSALTVRRRMALSKVAPELLSLYRGNHITQDQLQVLALVEDHTTQVHVWHSAPSYNRSAYNLRALVLAAEVSGEDRRARLVGLDAYRAAGGEIRSDLFSDSGSTYLKDVALLDRLYDEKLEAVRAQLVAEGWAWVERVDDLYGLHQFHRTLPTLRAMTAEEAEADATCTARMEELQAILEQISEQADQDNDEDGALYARQEAADQEIERLTEQQEAMAETRKEFTPAARAISGVRFCTSSGVLRIEAGLIRHADFIAQRKVEAQAQPYEANAVDADDDGDDGADTSKTVNGVEVAVSRYASNVPTQGRSDAAKIKAEYSEKVIADLSAHRTGAMQAAMLDNQRAALATLALSLLDASERGDYRLTSPAKIHGAVSSRSVHEKATGFAVSRAGLALSAAAQRLEVVLGHSEEGEASNQAGVFARLLALDVPALVEVLTYLTARTIDVIGPRRDTLGPDDELASALDLDMADYWTAGSDNFFIHVPKAKAVEAVTQARSTKEAEPLGKMKKGEAATAAESLVRERRWLPVPLRQSAAAPASIATQKE
ncbi:MAG: ParB/RepB/Spo0J family partition protein [Pseudomonas sp.]|nr:MAG: ParB/RepB/Spo0J family partition protein [Pseudomonas sp.]